MDGVRLLGLDAVSQERSCATAHESTEHSHRLQERTISFDEIAPAIQIITGTLSLLAVTQCRHSKRIRTSVSDGEHRWSKGTGRGTSLKSVTSVDLKEEWVNNTTQELGQTATESCPTMHKESTGKTSSISHLLWLLWTNGKYSSHCGRRAEAERKTLSKVETLPYFIKMVIHLPLVEFIKHILACPARI